MSAAFRRHDTPSFRRNARPAGQKRPQTRRPVIGFGPLPGAVIDAVLRYHDQAQDQGAGRTLLSLSAGRLGDLEVSRALGELTDRAGRVGILWNERESQIIRVMESPA
ncbi:hypothetical protein [Phenylobacterium immobile]|uniref:hypothetical protein n=1 Tax=Phenylobacterium immobile TaxID=21 RepID=UPI000A5A6585|nr:hypothetical protein [Phenylobacterium immobile]